MKQHIHNSSCYDVINFLRRFTYRLKHMTSPILTPEPPVSILKIPFDTDARFSISEGWIYSAEEQAVHGHVRHYGVDFATSRGTPIYAAADGWAVGSMHTYFQGLYKGKELGFGLGRFVQIWHPELSLFTLYGHLNEISSAVPYFAPELCDQILVPQILSVPTELLKSQAVYVYRGDMIGRAGDSGLSWGYEEQPGSGPDLNEHQSWDEIHLHFEVFTRDNSTHTKQVRYDPYGLYSNAEDYKQLNSKNFDFSTTAWMTGADGKPLRARAN